MENGFKSLIVWQKSMALAELVYVIVKKFPRSESFGLVSQIQRAAVSVPSNIAEGSRRSTRKDYAQFLSVAHGSLAELETQLLLARNAYPSKEIEDALEILGEISRMLHTLVRKLRT